MVINSTNTQALYFSSWTFFKTNREEFTYYTGVESGNPSGNKNIKSIAYIDRNGDTVLTRTFAYDSLDDIISIQANELIY
jgi:hypothetical protein